MQPNEKVRFDTCLHQNSKKSQISKTYSKGRFYIYKIRQDKTPFGAQRVARACDTVQVVAERDGAASDRIGWKTLEDCFLQNK